MKYEAKDIKETEMCENTHKYQYIEEDREGLKWQLCIDCDRKLLVR